MSVQTFNEEVKNDDKLLREIKTINRQYCRCTSFSLVRDELLEQFDHPEMRYNHLLTLDNIMHSLLLVIFASETY